MVPNKLYLNKGNLNFEDQGIVNYTTWPTTLVSAIIWQEKNLKKLATLLEKLKAWQTQVQAPISTELNPDYRAGNKTILQKLGL